jgi:hypothetical protein
VKEQSHKDEMSAALRGDFQRLRARGVPATLVPHDPAKEPGAVVDPTPADEPAPAVDRPQTAPPAVSEQHEPPTEAPPAEPVPVHDTPPDAPGPGRDDEPAPSRSGWLSRLVGR